MNLTDGWLQVFSIKSRLKCVTGSTSQNIDSCLTFLICLSLFKVIQYMHGKEVGKRVDWAQRFAAAEKVNY